MDAVFQLHETMMWIFIAREPSPEAPYWRGRRAMALVNALLWTVIGVLLLRHAVGIATVMGGVMLWALVGLALQRMPRGWLVRPEQSRHRMGCLSLLIDFLTEPNFVIKFFRH